MSEPKPCPFCGGKDLDIAFGSDPEVRVVCEDCFAEGPSAILGCRDPDEDEIDLEAEAWEAWNGRASQ